VEERASVIASRNLFDDLREQLSETIRRAADGFHDELREQLHRLGHEVLVEGISRAARTLRDQDRDAHAAPPAKPARPKPSPAAASDASLRASAPAAASAAPITLEQATTALMADLERPPLVAVRVVGCESTAKTPCTGTATERPCPNGCGWTVNLCERHGAGQSFGGRVAGHLRQCRRAMRHRPQAPPEELEEDEAEVGAPLEPLHLERSPVPLPAVSNHPSPSNGVAPATVLSSQGPMTVVKCALYRDDGMACGELVAHQDLKPHLRAHGMSSHAPEIHFVPSDWPLPTRRRSRPLTYRPGRRLPVLTDEDVADLPKRPKTRAECANVPRPCVFVSCRFSLWCEVKPNGGILLNHPHLEEPGLMPPSASCALDIADACEGVGLTLEETGMLLGITRERARQLELNAKVKLRGAWPEDEPGSILLNGEDE
jgi:hypothetical protein